MATSDLAPPRGLLQTADSRSQVTAARFATYQVLTAIASLRVTVVLFSLSIILIFLGTLAQKDQDVWRVVNDTYFRVWVAKVDLQVFERLVQLFRKSVDWQLQGWFPFPGGKLLGLCLLANLLAAHSIRFKVAAQGKRLILGVATIAVGVLVTYLVIRAGIGQTVESELSPRFCDFLWQCFRGLLAALTIAGAYVLVFWQAPAKTKLIEWRVLLVVDVLLGLLTVWLLANPEARVDNSGIRILWQLGKATVSGIILMAGCILVFRRRGGIVLLHGGIALIMLTELFTAVAAVESQMNIADGAAANFSSDMRTVELAVTDRSPSDNDRVTVVPEKMLVANVGASERIELPDIPFTVQVHQWMENSKLKPAVESEKNSATIGLGRSAAAVEIPATTGIGEFADQFNYPSAYVELFSKTTGKSLGTLLLSQAKPFFDEHNRIIDQSVQVDGRNYDLALRFQRIYHPFTVALKDFSLSHYVGTQTAKNYKSVVVFKDPEHNVEREVPIWMNNPLRYAGTTFYQQSFHVSDDRGEATGTVLQVVDNPSWMTPYVGCMLVVIGMLAHFGVMLVNFLQRRAQETERLTPDADAENAVSTFRQRKAERRQPKTAATTGDIAFPLIAKWFPAFIVALCALYIGSKARMPKSAPSEMKIYEFGELPLVYQGRVKPFDTVARNSLQFISGSQEVNTWTKKGLVKTRTPAIRWLLDAISGAKASREYGIFRIDNLDLLDALGLEQRPQFRRYSIQEIFEKNSTEQINGRPLPEVMRQIQMADAVPKEKRELYQHKVLELATKLSFYNRLIRPFESPAIPQHGSENEVKESLDRARAEIASLDAEGALRVIPPTNASTSWSTLTGAEFEYAINSVLQRPTNPATSAMSDMLTANARSEVPAFNKALGEYRAILNKYEQSIQANVESLLATGAAKAEILSLPKTHFEVFFNQFSPFYYAMGLYVIAFVLGILSWVGWTQPLRRASIWLLWFTFGLHTLALVARVYISGRPPITNLYSTAIVIGWAIVLLALVFESIQRLGLANIMAAVIGFITLFLAYNLSLDGDTFIVLQAVLDTQFWLATHVITINLGYAATYLTGAFGIVYILCAHVFPVLDQDDRKLVMRALYGTLCFAIFFSFLGTVLGGLWADDSWGRFWGWDPKENGALMIVLWNALVLHCRWGGLVKSRGLANLAIFGNIITTWSYFGVNEYGVGLHAYGAATSSTAIWLLTFGMTQLAVIGLGVMPTHWFQNDSGQIASTKA